MVVAAVLITVSGFAALAIRSGWPLIAGLFASAIYYVWHWQHVRLEPIAPEAVAAARRTEGVLSVAAIVALFLN